MSSNGYESERLRPGNRGGRPRKPADEKLGVQIALRMDSVLVSRLDQHMERLRQREPAVVWSRGSAIRWLMLQALAIAENGDGGARDDGARDGNNDEHTPRASTLIARRFRTPEVLAVLRELEGTPPRPVH